ncbi:MAG: tRNA dihydrouridine synthase [Minisyncoccota bacterium]
MRPYLGFWEKLDKPFFVLAPLANVTDVVFRRIIADYGKPDVLWTEFVSADGLCHPKGRETLLRDLWFTEAERPIVAQLFTAHPEKMFEASKLVAELGFDGIDINMGCPDKNVMKQGAGASCIKNPALMQALVIAAREGAKSSGKELPISVKTRLGFNEDTLEIFFPKLLEVQPAVITLHARTKKEMSKVPARWDRIKRAVELAKESGTLIIGNGDVRDLIDARAKVAETGVDGVMLGRSIFGNPWLFDEAKKMVTVEEKLQAVVKHTKLFEEVWGDTKSFALMKKHYQAYINHFPEARELRAHMMACRNAQEVEKVVHIFCMRYVDGMSQPVNMSI